MAEACALTRAQRVSREGGSRASGDKPPKDGAAEGLRPVNTGDASRPLFKVERW
jgi:putative transposase